MNPRGVERIGAALNFQEAGRLNKRRFAEAVHVEQLFPAGEGAVLMAMLVDAASSELIHAGNVAEQCAARAIELNADEADTRLHDIVERILEVLGARVVLV